MALRDLADEDLAVLRKCMAVVVGSSVFEDWEFHTLFGAERSEAAAVLASWPPTDPGDSQALLILNNALANLLYYPHGEDLHELVSASPERLREILDRLRLEDPDHA